jgi:D-alanyl-D-alanine carboxypeptidase (penicillin-binding protein 5/6)
MKKLMGIILLMSLTTFSFSATKKKTTKVTPKKTVVATKENTINEIKYKSLLLGDTEGRIYFQENINEKYPLASVTKMMSIMVVYDAIREGKVHLSDEVIASKEAATTPESHIPITPGEMITLEELLKAAAIKSANNAVYVMAEHVAGSIDEFVKLMNLKAKKLGLENELEFHTPAGLPSHITKKGMDVGTAKGIYELSREALKYPEYMEIAKLEKTTLKNGTVRISNTNKLLGKNGINGIKTGYHTKSMFNIAVHSQNAGIDTIVIVFGGNTSKNRDQKVLDTLDKFHSEYKLKKIIDSKKPLLSIPVSGGEVQEVTLYPEKDFSYVLANNAKVRMKIDRIKVIESPMEKGGIVGIYTVTSDGKEIESGKLILQEDIKSKNIFKNFLKNFKKSS